MSELIEEVKIWNTPAVGAFLLYWFTKGFVSAHQEGAAPNALNHFIAGAILTNDKLKAPISNMRNDLQSYVRSFEDHKNSDLLLDIQQRVKAKLSYTWAAIDIAVSTGLLFWEPDEASLYVRSGEELLKRGNAPKPDLKRDGEKAEILGRWFAEHDISTVCTYLKIVL
ncbi:hypothetical protein DBR40_07275 [Pedobacter sp. KBW01]|uniref:three component ABC system middle component n=1 Tax=Pedobacter sp. KBW01 TaxID=2153364 RepID=UPI000F597E8B|nr:three component ABC system middle component [Pedobacter sp. KBW01]RQO77769.1 hypothetical protein DBR40_07275 [Pedobacter sp. KBW01]